MFFHDINDNDFIELLQALPSSPAMTRAHILGAFGVLVSGDNPADWWYALTIDRGEEGAAKAVAQLIISKGGKRVVSLIKAEADGRGVAPRADDPKLAQLLRRRIPTRNVATLRSPSTRRTQNAEMAE